MLHGLMAGMLLQSCVALLPPARAEIEWFRDGRPWAVDVPVRTSSTERVYRRRPRSGAAVERTMSCSTTNGVSWLTDRVGSTTVRLPVGLPVGSARIERGSTVRRIQAPADAEGSRAAWYTVSNPGVTVYAVGSGSGVVEVRSPRGDGSFTILRGTVRTPPPPALGAELDSVRDALSQRVLEVENENAVLRDSIGSLLRRPAPDSARSAASLPEFHDLERLIRLMRTAHRRPRGAP